MVLLETRLDNIVYRAGFALSRSQARQLVTHGHFLVNGRKVDIPSYRVNAGDVISAKEKSREAVAIRAAIDAGREIQEWLSVTKDKVSAEVLSLPTRDVLDMDINEQLIVEFFSK